MTVFYSFSPLLMWSKIHNQRNQAHTCFPLLCLSMDSACSDFTHSLGKGRILQCFQFSSTLSCFIEVERVVAWEPTLNITRNSIFKIHYTVCQLRIYFLWSFGFMSLGFGDFFPIQLLVFLAPEDQNLLKPQVRQKR